MIGIGLALVVLGITSVFVIPFGLRLSGFGRREARGEHPVARRS
jgi:hypothetical protein